MRLGPELNSEPLGLPGMFGSLCLHPHHTQCLPASHQVTIEAFRAGRKSHPFTMTALEYSLHTPTGKLLHKHQNRCNTPHIRASAGRTLSSIWIFPTLRMLTVPQMLSYSLPGLGTTVRLLM